jgi:hypothetical protein
MRDADGTQYADAHKAMTDVTYVMKLLEAAGMPEPAIPFAAAQAAFETGGFKSHISKVDNNWSGIKWINKPYQNATKGSPAPSREGGYYAHFDSPQDWATDFVRILSLGAQKPKDAASIEDYVTRLHDNRYFTANPAIYLRGVQTVLRQMQGLKKDDVQLAQFKQDYAAEHKEDWFMKWWNKLSFTEKALLILGGVVVTGAIIKR